MKKILLSLLAATGFAASASAQLTEGTLFPYPGGATGGLTAVNAPYTGLKYNLDSLSEAGYTIFVDISATWCPPCWAYHNGKQLDSLWYFHGPTGMPGVSASTTNDVFVIFFQGEQTSKLAELNGDAANGAIVTTGESDLAHDTQGNWVAGTPFPMVDDTTSTDATYGTNAINAAWNIHFFPTVYMICRDHIVHNLTQPSYTAAYAAAQAGCPTTAPATGASVDAKASVYTGNAYFTCNAAPSVTFQNYSTTASITAATITVTDGAGTTVATIPWTGSLAPYQITTVAIPSFAGTSFGGYKYNVSVTGDIAPANNISVDSVFKIYASSNASALPYSDNLTGAISYKYSFPTDGSIGLPNPLWSGCPGPDGVTTNRYLLVDFFDFTAGTGNYDFVVGNFNTTGLATTFKFAQAYKMYDATSIDQLFVKVSNDCGATWHTVWSASGSTLASVTGYTSPSTSGYVPAGASDWVQRSIDIPSTYAGSNMMVKITGTSGYGNFAWVTDLRLAQTPLTVAQVQKAGFINVVPNPAKDMANVQISISEPTTVKVQVMDAVGRTVYTTSREFGVGDQEIALPTSDMNAGLYYVRITAGDETTTKTLSVIK